MRTGALTLALFATIVLSGAARAALPSATCQRVVASAGAKFVQVALKVSQRCSIRAARTGSGTDCEPHAGRSTGDAKTDAVIERAALRLGARVADACAGSDLSAFARPCPDPTGPPLSLAELVTCLRDTHLDRVGAMIHVEFPRPFPTGSWARGGCIVGEDCQCSCSPSGAFLDGEAGDVR